MQLFDKQSESSWTQAKAEKVRLADEDVDINEAGR